MNLLDSTTNTTPYTALLPLPTEKEVKKSQKRLEKDLKQQQKQLERQQKDQAKTCTRIIKECNKLRNKHETCQEMMVEISKDLMIRNGDEIMAILQEIGVEAKYADLPVKNTINWKRIQSRVWSQEREMWVPCDEEIIEDDYFLVQLDGFEFAEIVSKDVETHFQALRQQFPKKKIIYLIEEMERYYSTLQKDRNRAFQNAMRDRDTNISKKSRIVDKLPSKQEIEDALLQLQMDHSESLHVLFSKKEETASWIKTLTHEISIYHEWKYRNEEALQLQFGDSVKSGKTLKDSWCRMLQCVHMVTESRAQAIVHKYPTFQSLYREYLFLGQQEGERVLANVQV
jgi:hypothetical protein